MNCSRMVRAPLQKGSNVFWGNRDSKEGGEGPQTHKHAKGSDKWVRSIGRHIVSLYKQGTAHWFCSEAGGTILIKNAIYIVASADRSAPQRGGRRAGENRGKTNGSARECAGSVTNWSKWGGVFVFVYENKIYPPGF